MISLLEMKVFCVPLGTPFVLTSLWGVTISLIWVSFSAGNTCFKDASIESAYIAGTYAGRVCTEFAYTGNICTIRACTGVASDKSA